MKAADLTRKSVMIGIALLVLFAWSIPGALAQPLPGGTLYPLEVLKYQTPLLIPPQMPVARIVWDPKIKKFVDYYEIAVRQFNQQILPAGLPMTTVWGYGPAKTLNPNTPVIFNAPSLTIEARHNRPVRIKWINDLVDADGNYLPHLLPVDPTLHWANPPGGTTGRDTRPTFDSTPDPYTGPVPLVTHVHGAVGVGDESDGYAEAWYLPAANDIPGDYATEGTWYDFFAGKANAKFGVTWGPGFATFQYPNANRASTIWYHDHALGMTRLNVYAGPAGFYIVRGGPDARVLDKRFKIPFPAILPGPAPGVVNGIKDMIVTRLGLNYHEIPIAIQDRSFNTDGSLFYPDSREFFDGATADDPGFIPTTDLSPIWNPEFFGNMMMVNGNTWPYLDVEKRRYRLRFLNGCNSRFLILDFTQIPGVKVWQIGNEGGFLAAPVNLSATNGNRLLMGLAERADLIVDFTNVPVGNYVLGNVGPDEPFGGGVPCPPNQNPDANPGCGDFAASDPSTTGQIMQFRVVNRRGLDLSTPPQFLKLPAIKPLPTETNTRKLALLEEMSMFWDGPAAAMLGNIEENGNALAKMWADAISENPNVGDTEIWELYNFTADAHPMHIHEIVFEVVNRQPITFTEDGMGISNVQAVGVARSPEAWESGFKDTAISYPGEVLRLRAKFDTPGQYVWHCHIVEHEDNEMMRPYRIGPEQPGQPGSMAMSAMP